MKRLCDLKRIDRVKQCGFVMTHNNELLQLDYIFTDGKVHFLNSNRIEYLDTVYPILATKENEDIIFKAISIDIECDFHFSQKKCVFWNKGKLYFKNGIQIKKIKYIHDLQNIFDKYDEKFDVNLDAEISETNNLF